MTTPGNNGTMRQRFLVLVVVLTIMTGTIVVASGIWREPIPEATVSAEMQRPAAPKTTRDLSRPPLDRALPALPDEQASTEPGVKPRAGDAGAEPPVRLGAPAEAGEQPSQDPDGGGLDLTATPVPGGVVDVEVPVALGGDFLIAPGSQDAPDGRVTYQVRVEVEDGLPVSVEEFSAFAMETLNDERSWAHDGAVTFARTDGDADIRVVLASPATVDENCAPLKTGGKWSCGRYGHAMINAARWVSGADAFTGAGGEIEEYRRYLINHEVGHLLGYQHESCTTPGSPAPVMTQQSLYLQGCTPNGWAHP